MDKIKELEQQLAEAKREEQLRNEIQEARCPLCGSKLEFTARNGDAWGDCREFDTIAEIKCPSCKCFGYSERIHQSYYDTFRTKPTELLASVWAKVSRYVVKQQTT